MKSFAQDLPLAKLIIENDEFSLEIRWEKTKDWRPRSKILAGKDQLISYHEVGKATIRADYISDIDVKLHINQDSDELKAKLN